MSVWAGAGTGSRLGLGGCQALTASLGGSSGVEVGKPTHFTVLTKGAGKAKLDVQFAGTAKGEVVRDFEIIDNHDYSYTVKYTAVQQVRSAPPMLPPGWPARALGLPPPVPWDQFWILHAFPASCPHSHGGSELQSPYSPPGCCRTLPYTQF